MQKKNGTFSSGITESENLWICTHCISKKKINHKNKWVCRKGKGLATYQPTAVSFMWMQEYSHGELLNMPYSYLVENC